MLELPPIHEYKQMFRNDTSGTQNRTTKGSKTLCGNITLLNKVKIGLNVYN